MATRATTTSKSDEVDKMLLNLPFYENTRGLNSYEKNLAVENWKKLVEISINQVQPTPSISTVDAINNQSKTVTSKIHRIPIKNFSSRTKYLNVTKETELSLLPEDNPEEELNSLDKKDHEVSCTKQHNLNTEESDTHYLCEEINEELQSNIPEITKVILDKDTSKIPSAINNQSGTVTSKIHRKPIKNYSSRIKITDAVTSDVTSPEEPYVSSGSEYLPTSESDESSSSDSSEKCALFCINNEQEKFETEGTISSPPPLSNVNFSTSFYKSNHKNYTETESVTSQSTISSSSMLQKNSKVRVPTSSTIGTHTKKFFCLYCKSTVKRFARHLIANHKKEPKVIEILRFPSKHKERINLINKIRNEGTFMYNTSKSYNQGDLIVTRRPNVVKKRKVKDYSPCPFCFAYFISKNLNRHVKNCILNKNISNSRGIQAQSRNIQIEMDLQHLRLHPHVAKLLSGLKCDIISETIKNDIVLLRLASHLCVKFRTEQHLKHYTRQKLRQLARLLIVIKEDNPQIIDFKDCLQPANFSIVVAGVQKVAKLNEETGEFAIPSLANHLGIYLKECASTLYAMCITEQDEVRKKLVTDFKELMSLQFGASISRAARKTMEQSTWNKPKLLPVTSDIQIFRDHLIKKAEAAKNYLEKNEFSYAKWRVLVEMTAALVLIFNRKRPGETERILLSSYHQKQTIDENDENYDNLTVLERLLCKSLKRIEIRGKLGRRVPILLRENHIQYIDTFLNLREKAGVLESNLYLFAIDHKIFLRLTDIMRRESIESGARNPELLRGTFLRKQVATTSQILDLNDNDMQMLADFMGHDIQIHKSHYRTPELTVQVAKLSRLLIAVDEGDLSNYKDKSLKNIDVTKYLNVTKETELSLLPEDNPEEELNSLDKKDHEVSCTKQHNLNTEESDTHYLCEEINEELQSNIPEITKVILDKDTSEITGLSNLQNTNIRKRKHYRAPNFLELTSSRYISPPKQKQRIKRTSWRTPEKKIVRKLFNSHFEARTLPSEREAAALISQQPILSHRTPLQLKAWISNQHMRSRKNAC